MESHNSVAAKKIRPDEGDQAIPLCYGDIIMLSCSVNEQSTAYLCEEGCVMKQDLQVEMRASSRELTFEVFSAHDTRALHEINQMLRKYAIPASTSLDQHLSFRYNFNQTDTARFERLLKKRETEESANQAYTKQLNGRAVTYGDQIRLKHTERQAFLGVDVSQAPRMESSAKRIFLTSDPHAFVKFKIMPRFRYLSEGNTVCFGDNISLSSADHLSEFLHCSAGFTKEKIGLVFEVNLNRDRSTIWSLDRFVAYNPDSQASVKAGDVVRFYHPSVKGFIAAASTDSDDQISVEKSSTALSQMASTMWVVQAEGTADGLLRTMRTLSLMHLVSQRYLVVTEAELILVPPGSGRTPRELSADRDSLFCQIVLSQSAVTASNLLLHPLEDSQANNCIKWGEHYRIVDSATNRFVHVVDRPPWVHHDRGPGSQTQDAHTLVASPALFRDDSFEVQRVPDDQVRAVGALSKMLPPLREYRDALKKSVDLQLGAEFPVDRVVDTVERLEALGSFVYTASAGTLTLNTLQEDSAVSPVPFCQNFMRNLGVADLLMDILRQTCHLLRKKRFLALRPVPETMDDLAQALSSIVRVPMSDLGEEIEKLENRPALIIAEIAFKVLRHMVRRHKQNATYVARYLAEIQEQLALRVGAEILLHEMLADNEVLLAPECERRRWPPSPFQKRHIRFHIEALVREGKDPRHLAFLSAMVAIGDCGIREHQDLVLPELIKYQTDVLLEWRVQSLTVQLKDPRRGSSLGNEWTDLSMIAAGAGRRGELGASMKQAMLEYWQEYLLLLANLCKPDESGRRDFVIRKVQSLVSFELCLCCLQDESLPNHVRWTACELLRLAFVEQDEFVKGVPSAGVAIWNDLDRIVDRACSIASIRECGSVMEAGAEIVPHSYGFSSSQAADLKKTVVEFFEKNIVTYYPPRIDYANRLKMSLLRLLRQLILFGHFNFGELESVAQIAVNVLDLSNVRMEDEDQKMLRNALAAGKVEVSSGEANKADFCECSNQGADSELAEQSISCALRKLRLLVGELPPLEVPRLRCVFKARVYNAGDIIAEQGAVTDAMYVIQSGNAFILQTIGDEESVVGTLGPGEIFGAEQLRENHPIWPWQLRCSTRLTVLCLPRSKFAMVLERLYNKEPTKLTDGIMAIYNMQKESCSMINDIYDLRLQVRSKMLLQEYCFDVNISKRRYRTSQLVTSPGSMDMSIFPVKSDSINTSPSTVFIDLSEKLIDFIFPNQRCFCGMLGMFESVVLLCCIQFLLATLIFALVAARLAAGDERILHPGPALPPAAAILNLIMSSTWGVFNLIAMGNLILGSGVLAKTLVWIQLCYVIYFAVNTLSNLVEALNDTTSIGQNIAVSQALWIASMLPFTIYSNLVFFSVAVRNPRTIFSQSVGSTGTKSMSVSTQSIVTSKFSKALNFFDLSQDPLFLRVVTDQVVSKSTDLVVNAFTLLVRTHNSIDELFKELSGVVLLIDDEKSGIHSQAIYLKAHQMLQELLDATHGMQAFNMDRTNKSKADRAQMLLQEILLLIDNKAPLIQRQLFQRLNIHRIVIKLLSCLTPDQIRVEGSLCYSILSCLCDQDKRVKADVSMSIDLFSRHLEIMPKMVAVLLISLYADELDLCESVEEALIERIAFLMKTKVDECYLVLLRVIVAPKENSQPIRRLQNFVMKYLCSDFFLSSLSLNDRFHLRFRQVSGTTMAKLSADLRVYTALVELLSTCMAENNVEAKNRCRGSCPFLSLSLESIQQQLKDRNLPLPTKKALVRFMEEAYIKVEFSARHFLVQPELFSIFDEYARQIKLLPADQDGCKLSALGLAKRELFMKAYLSALLSYLSLLSVSDFIHEETRVRMALHLLESLVDIIRSGSYKSRHGVLSLQEEFDCLQAIQLLTELIEPCSVDRLCYIQDDLCRLLGTNPAEEKVILRRKLHLRQQMAEEALRKQRTNLDISDGVKVFANEFLVYNGSSPNLDIGASVLSIPRKLLDCVRQVGSLGTEKKNLLVISPVPSASSFSNVFMDSLVDLLENAVCSPGTLQPKLFLTGLSIILEVVKKVPLSKLEPGSEKKGINKDTTKWLDYGIPKLIIKCVCSTISDVGFASCIAIGNSLLDRKKRHYQDAFHNLLSADSGAVFFGSLKERLMRAERALSAFQVLFWRKAQELSVDCEAHGRVLTISGIRDVCVLDRSSKDFAGSHAIEVLRFLQLLCEGHNRKMQDFVRDQGKNSSDLVVYIADFLVSASRQMYPMGIPLVLQCLDTLIEFVQNPCPANQRVLVDSQLPNALNQLLQADIAIVDRGIKFFDMPLYQRQTEDVKTKTVTLLLSLLEKVDGPFIPSRILEALEIDNLVHEINALRSQYRKFCDDIKEEGMIARKELSECGPFKVACSLFMLLMTLRHYDLDDQHRLSMKCSKKGIMDISLLRANCGFVEISRDGILERIFFQIPAVCRFLTEQAKSSISITSAEATNHQDKMLHFVRQVHGRHEEMIHLQRLTRSFLYRSYTLVSPRIEKLFFINALLLNILCICGFRYKDDSWLTLQSVSNIFLPSSWFWGILGLAIVQLLMTIIRLVGYYFDLGILEVRRKFNTERYRYVLTEFYGGPHYYFLFCFFLIKDKNFIILSVFLVTNILAIGLCGINPLSFLMFG